jgi:adenosine kinase
MSHAKKPYNNVIIVGSVAYDEIMQFPSEFVKHFHPEKLDQINVSFVVDKLEKHLGGTATNIAYNISLASDTKPRILAGVGKDYHIFFDFFKSHGIETSGIMVDEDLYTATGKVITDSRGNQIWGFYYGACASARDISLSDHVTKDDIVVISATHKDPFLRAQREARDIGAAYLYDPGMALTYISDEDLAEGVFSATWLVGNEYEIAHIEKALGQSYQSFVKKGITVIVTQGEKGVSYQSPSDSYTIPAYTDVTMVDPTGAGDAWRAGFVAGIRDRLDTPDALRQANALASFQIEQYGTVNHAPTRQQIRTRTESLS